MDINVEALLDSIYRKESVEDPNVSDVSYLKDILNSIEVRSVGVIKISLWMSTVFFLLGLCLGYVYKQEYNRPI